MVGQNRSRSPKKATQYTSVADVHFSAQNLKKRPSRPRALVSAETCQSFSWKNDLACFHCSYNDEQEDIWAFLAFSEDKLFLVKKEDVS